MCVSIVTKALLLADESEIRVLLQDVSLTGWKQTKVNPSVVSLSLTFEPLIPTGQHTSPTRGCTYRSLCVYRQAKHISHTGAIDPTRTVALSTHFRYKASSSESSESSESSLPRLRRS
jgi:hypothetical protein